jgi:ribosome maturation factor RimP
MVKLTVQNEQGIREFTGAIESVDEAMLSLKTENGVERYPLANIIKGKIIF